MGAEPRGIPVLGRREKYPDGGDEAWSSLNVWLVALSFFYRHCYKSCYLSPLTTRDTCGFSCMECWVVMSTMAMCSWNGSVPEQRQSHWVCRLWSCGEHFVGWKALVILLLWMTCVDTQPVERGNASLEGSHFSIKCLHIEMMRGQVYFTVLCCAHQSSGPWPWAGHRAKCHEPLVGSLQVISKGSWCLVYNGLTTGWMNFCHMSIQSCLDMFAANTMQLLNH